MTRYDRTDRQEIQRTIVKRPVRKVSLPIFSGAIILLVAIGLEFFGEQIDPWALRSRKPLVFARATYPSLAGLGFECAERGEILGSLNVQSRTGACAQILTDQTTRCIAGLPLLSFGDKIRCPEPENVRCSDAGVQTLGLFKGDVYCAKAADVDIGPPPANQRTEN